MIVIFSYLRSRFFSIFFISYDFMLTIFFSISIDSEFVERDRLNESSSEADFN